MRINKPADFRLNNTYSNTGKVDSSNSKDEYQTLYGVLCCQFTAFQLKPARFLIKKGLFTIEAQTILISCMQIGGFITNDIPGIISLILGESNS